MNALEKEVIGKFRQLTPRAARGYWRRCAMSARRIGARGR